MTKHQSFAIRKTSIKVEILQNCKKLNEKFISPTNIGQNCAIPVHYEKSVTFGPDYVIIDIEEQI